MIIKSLNFAIIIFSFAVLEVFPQTFGFGCFGLVGGYGGYSFQLYKPTGINNYFDDINTTKEDSLKAPIKHFGQSQGYRIGLNFFRAKMKGFVLTAKGYYQVLAEKTSADITSSAGVSNESYKFQNKTLAIGIDLGVNLTRALSWKVVDAAVHFNNAELNNTRNDPNGHTSISVYKTEKSSIGYSIGTGFILELIDEYITLEGLAAYTILKIDKLRTDDEVYLTETESSSQVMNNFIEAGGFNAVIQLNIGFPL